MQSKVYIGTLVLSSDNSQVFAGLIRIIVKDCCHYGIALVIFSSFISFTDQKCVFILHSDKKIHYDLILQRLIFLL